MGTLLIDWWHVFQKIDGAQSGSGCQCMKNGAHNQCLMLDVAISVDWRRRSIADFFEKFLLRIGVAEVLMIF